MNQLLLTSYHFQSPLWEILIDYYQYSFKNMWNIFRGKHSPQQEKSGEQDAEQLARQLRAKFDQKMKTLSQSIKQSEEFFMRYAQVSQREQQLGTTFEQIMATLEGLVSIIEELSREMSQVREQLDELNRAKHMVANHHSIVSNLQDTYSEQIRNIYAEHQQILTQTKVEQQQLRQEILTLLSEKQSLREQLTQSQQTCENLEMENSQLKAQNSTLRAQVQQLSVKYQRFLQGGQQGKKVINFEVMKLEYLFYYGRLKEGITVFLTISDFQQLKRTSKFFRHSLQKEESKFLVRSLSRQQKQQQSVQSVNLKHYQRVMELFPQENIKFNAIKYLHFRIKPASYILPYLQEENQLPQQPKLEPEPKQKDRKFNWRGLFASEKQKKEKEEPPKFSLSQLKNDQEFKRVEGKVEATFKSVLSVRMPEDLKYFSQTMERQLGELKESLGSRGGRGGVAGWAAELHCLCRFMYLEISELYNLLQAVFGELVVKSRRLSALQEAHDELKDNETILRNLIENLSHDKANLQKKAVLIQNEILKRNLQKDSLASNYEQIVVQATQSKIRYQNLLVEYNNLRKLFEKEKDERKIFDENFMKIRKELEILQGAPRERKFSQGSVCSDASRE